MARDFTKNTANYVSLGTEVVVALISGASAVSLAGWVYFDSLTDAANANRLLTAVIDGTNSGLVLETGSGNVTRVGGRSQSADGFQAVNGTTALGTGAWIHLGGVLNIAGDSIRVYYNGTQEASTAVTFGAATYTDNGAPSTGDAIGGYRTPPIATGDQVDGRIAELAIWNGDIATAGFLQLSKGLSPAMVRPDLLVAYWPLIGQFSPEIEIISGKIGTITGTVAGASHPRIFYPTSFQDRRFTTAAGAATSVKDLIMAGILPFAR